MRPPLRYLLVGTTMVLAAGVALAITPKNLIAEKRPIALDTMIPREIGPWKVDPSVLPLAVSPDVKAKIDEIYGQTLSRTYVNERGQRIMLSIAYGGNQGDSMSVHRPEVCYTAQGFQILAQKVGEVLTRMGKIPVTRLVAAHGVRYEPITYWVTVGDRAVLPGLEQKLAQLRYGLTGQIPDGMLVRVSSIGREEAREYSLQDEFIGALLNALNQQWRERVAGIPLGHQPQ